MRTYIFHLNLNLDLPYNVIYYFPDCGYREFNDAVAKAIERWSGSSDVREIQHFDFQYHYVEEGLLNDLRKLNPTDEEDTYGELVLRKLLGTADGGILVVRPAPDIFSSNLEDEESDLLIGRGMDVMDKSAPAELKSFAIAAAKVNFERMTGMDYHQYRMQSDFMSPEASFSTGHFLEVMTVGSRSRSQRPNYGYGVEQKIRQSLAQMGNQSNTASMNEIEAWIQNIQEEVQNGRKICRKTKVFVDYDDEKTEYEVIVENGDELPVRCEFERGIMPKTLYIFLLRHPEGVRVRELPEHKRELNRIYNLLTGQDSYEENVSVDNLCNNNKDTLKVLKWDIKHTLEDIFATGIVADYCVTNYSGRLKIPIEDDYVELRRFGFKA